MLEYEAPVILGASVTSIQNSKLFKIRQTESPTNFSLSRTLRGFVKNWIGGWVGGVWPIRENSGLARRHRPTRIFFNLIKPLKVIHEIAKLPLIKKWFEDLTLINSFRNIRDYQNWNELSFNNQARTQNIFGQINQQICWDIWTKLDLLSQV